MLDLTFVRDNLPLVEEKLRQRGMDPAAVLKDFREVDTQRRASLDALQRQQSIRRTESEKIAGYKKKQKEGTASAADLQEMEKLVAQTRELGNFITGLDADAAQKDARLREILA